MKRIGLLVVAALAVAWIGTVQAATDEQKCLAGRAKAKGKYVQCVEKWLAKGYGGGGLDAEKFGKCRIKYAGAFTKLQELAGTPCALARWVDNGNGTVTDNLTGLVWEKKTDDGTVHDWDNTVMWSSYDGDLTDEDGTAFTTFLSGLNSGAGFAGANGWRLPTLAELGTILLPESPCTADPCIDSTVFGFTHGNFYKSATTTAFNPEYVWEVGFSVADVGDASKPADSYVRAVRGGL